MPASSQEDEDIVYAPNKYRETEGNNGDYAKTLYKSTPPKSIGEQMRSFTKALVPSFFIYAKDKTPDQVEPPTNSTMNRIMQAIPDSKIKYSKDIGKFDYRMLMNLNYGADLHEGNIIVDRYQWWNKRQKSVFNTEDDGSHANMEDLYAFKTIRKKIIEETGFPADYIVNTLVTYLYTIRPNSTKKLFWACFGKELVDNLERNLADFDLGRICQVCGKRFHPTSPNQKTCSQQCGKVLDNEKRLLKKKKLRGC